MKTFIGLVELFFLNSKLKIARCMEYRFDFIVGVIVGFFITGFGPLAQYLIYSQTKGYPGWTIQQLILFQGLMLLWFGIRDTVFGDLKQYALDIVRKGDFDRLLLKPYPSIGIILTSGFNIKNSSSVIVGFILTIYGVNNLKLTLGLSELLLVMTCFIFGFILNLAIDIFYCGVTIVLVQINRFEEFIENVLNFSRYPVEIFLKIARIFILSFIPLALWVYYPTQVFLHRIDWSILSAFVATSVIFLISLRFWNWCLKKYSSAGG